jgi:hypothetical protein
MIALPGPRKSTPEIRASLRTASVADVRSRIEGQSQVSVTTWIYVGRALAATKAAAQKDGEKVFPAMFPKNAEERKDPAKYPFSRRMADVLILIAERFGNSVSKSHLPSSWGTLYVLSGLDPKGLERLVESGAVHPMMTRAEASKLASTKTHKAKKPKTVCDSAAKYFLKIKSTEERARQFLVLLKNAGLTLNNLQEVES